MATVTIEKVENKSSTKFKARVRLTKKGKKVYEESKTFPKHLLAKRWAEKLVVQLESDGSPRKKNRIKSCSIGEMIERYLEDPATNFNLGRTKTYVLRSLLHYDIAHIDTTEVTANDLVEHCRTRASESTKPKPQTIYQDVTYLKSVMEVAETMLNIDVDLSYHHKAINSLVKFELIGRSAVRNRRPTATELEQMTAGLRKREKSRSCTIPHVDIFTFALLTCMRIGEITRIKWSDFDTEQKTILVRDRKSPKNKRGNNSEIPLVSEALEIMLRQPRKPDQDLIFPHNARSVSAGWQRVRDIQGIKDLRLHDLRAEGATRLIENNVDIVTVSKITGHKNIDILNNIYLRVHGKSLHERLKLAS